MNKQNLKNEIIACGRDPSYFIQKYVKIRHPVRGIIPFAIFDYQKNLIDAYRANRFNVILKARQMGISEVTAAYAAWLMLFHRDKNILVIATKAETAKNIVKKVKLALTKIPRWLILADIVVDNKMSLELSNGSVIKAIASSGDAGRSEALSLLIVDEAAFIDNMEDIWTGLFPTVQAGGRVIVLSTPNGVGNIFHKLYSDGEAKNNDFHATRLIWWLHPERTSDLQDDPNRPGFKTSSWYRKEIKGANMSARDIAQELECNFNSSGDNVITADLMDYIDTQVITPISMEETNRKLFIWKEYEQRRRYVLSADVARGDGNDFSTFHVFDVETMEQVAEYCAQLPVDEFAKVICSTGQRYGNCLVAIENNNVGTACLEHVKIAKYPNVYYSRKGDVKAGDSVNTEFGAFDENLVPGFTTSAKTRPLMISKFEEYIRARTTIFHSKRFLAELRTFIWNNGRAEAAKGYNDDLIMAAAIGIWLRDTFITPNSVGVDMQKKMLMNISMQTVLNTDINGASKDPRLVPRQTMKPMITQRNPYEMRLPSGGVIDFRELLDEYPRKKR